jgi:hypothetical protein
MKHEVTLEMLQRLNAEHAESRSSASSAPGFTASVRALNQGSSISLGWRPPPETPTEVAKLKGALAVLTADVPRGAGKLYDPDGKVSDQSWLIVIWGIASLGWQCGKDIARGWSRQSERYTDEGFDKAWSGHNPNHAKPIRIGSLYELAKSRGWNGGNDFHQEPVVANRARYTLLGAAEIDALPPTSWRLKNIFPSSGLGAIYGASGSGKSFLAIDLAAAIAEGVPWFGYKTVASPVVYVMLEGQGGLANRKRAWEEAKGRALPTDLKVVIDPFQLAEMQDLSDLIAVITRGATVFIDTLNRAAPTADENSSKDMGLILQSAEILQRSTNGLVIIVHHTGKDTSKGMRGHSSLFAAMDGAIEVTRNPPNRHWSVAKSKDGEDGKEVAFRLVTHNLGKDPDGEDVTSCSVERDLGTLFAKPAPKGKRQQQAFKAAKAELAKSTTLGLGGCTAQTQCAKVEDLIPVIAVMLTTTDKSKRTNEARRLLTSLTTSGHLGSGLDAAGDAWCWLAV